MSSSPSPASRPGLLVRLIPIVGVLRGYSRQAARDDLLAALSTSVVLLPQAFAYATMAGLPPHVGIYAATIPLFAYAILGRSPLLAIGPTAVDSLMTAGVIGAAAIVATEHVEAAVTLAVLVGLVQLALGLMRLGVVAKLMTQPVVVGFSAGAGVLIALNQFKLVSGIPFGRVGHLRDLFAHFGDVPMVPHTDTLVLGLSTLAMLVLLRFLKPRWPRALFAVVITLGLTYFGLCGDVATVGDLPSVLPVFAVPSVDHLSELLPGAILLAIVGFAEATSIDRALAPDESEAPPPNGELIALSFSNILAGLFRAFPVTAGFSRSALHAASGPATTMAGAMTGGLILLYAALASGAFAYIPDAALGAIIMDAVIGLLRPKKWRPFLRDKPQLVTAIVCLSATLVLGIVWGLAIGIAWGQLTGLVMRKRVHSTGGDGASSPDTSMEASPAESSDPASSLPD